MKEKSIMSICLKLLKNTKFHLGVLFCLLHPIPKIRFKTISYFFGEHVVKMRFKKKVVSYA